MAGNTTELTNSIKAALDFQADQAEPDQDIDALRQKLAEDIVSGIDEYIQSLVVKVELDQPVSSVFTGAIPVPMDGGAAINIAYQANAGAYPNTATGNLE